MLADGSTGSYGGDIITQGATESSAPPPAGEELRDLDRDWARCKSDGARRRVIRAALDCIRLHRFPKADIRRLRGTREWKEAIAAEHHPVGIVAKMYDVSERSVKRYRAGQF